MTWRCGLTRILRSLGRDFLVCTRFFTLTVGDTTAARRDAAKEALENAQKLQPNSPETLLFTGYYQYWVLHDYGLAKATFEQVSKILPGNSEVLYALAAIARSEGHWDESIAYWERGLALNPRNTALLTEVAFTYAALRQFPKAAKALRSGTGYPPE